MILIGEPIKELLRNQIKSNKYLKDLSFFLYSNKEDVASFYYLKGIKKVLDEFNIPFEEDFLEVYKKEEDVINLFKTKSRNKMVILARPLPNNYEEKLIPLIDPNFDPDMMSTYNIGKLYSGDLNYLPATAKSVESIIKYYNLEFEDKKVTIVGRSNTVGLPIFMLINKLNGLCVLTHSKINKYALKKEAKNSEYIILCSGKSGLIRRSSYESYQTVIDCGFSSYGGDLGFVPEEYELKNYTPVPKGVGSLTSYELIINALFLLENKK